ncbi:BnaC07g12920D [Brassica napus]|uniref:BnaC07g12920D protein n=1 Tax=Brassica napus TaxID=3708 RepID=A0A078GTF3_BRANA|nr:BnaC07g12920D [Brassica napus]
MPHCELPLWPSAADLNDESRFYMVNRSEWEATGWILMYLVLVIYSHDKLIVTVIHEIEMSLLGKLCGGKFTGKQGSVTRRSG